MTLPTGLIRLKFALAQDEDQSMKPGWFPEEQIIGISRLTGPRTRGRW